MSVHIQPHKGIDDIKASDFAKTLGITGAVLKD